jgi:hypothetical protein
MSSLVDNVNEIVQSPFVLNMIGTDLIGMTYTQNTDGSWSFKVPVITDTDEEDVKKQQTIGDIYKKLIAPIQNKKKIKFINKTKFMLYNDKIEVVNDEYINDINIANIVVNVISIYVAQIFKKGTEDGRE